MNMYDRWAAELRAIAARLADIDASEPGEVGGVIDDVLVDMRRIAVSIERVGEEDRKAEAHGPLVVPTAEEIAR